MHFNWSSDSRVLLITSTPEIAIYINAIAFLLSGFITLLLPNLDKKEASDTTSNTLSLTVLKRLEHCYKF